MVSGGPLLRRPTTLGRHWKSELPRSSGRFGSGVLGGNINAKKVHPFCTTSAANPSDVNPVLLRRLYRILMRQFKTYHSSNIVNIYPPISIQHEGMSLRDEVAREATSSDVLEYYRMHAAYEASSSPVVGDENRVVMVKFDTDDKMVFQVPPKSDHRQASIAMKPLLWCHTDTLQDTIRSAFRGLEPATTTDDAIAAFRILRQQQNYVNRTFSHLQSPHLIRITAVSQLVRQSSDQFRYGYRIRIENMNPNVDYKLMGRTWHIRPDTASDEVISVRAENGGAVGEFPVLKPRNVFEYQSAAEATAHGSMEGYFHFRNLDSGETFPVAVGPFPLGGEA